jgi:ABC-2 type transport system ATP-binding protein
MIQVDNLTKLYGELVAVDGLSFAVAPGEVLGLVGPNGAGKTTTLRSLVGIVRPTRGTIMIGGRDLERDPVAAKRQLAFMPDEPHLFDYLTVEEHLRFTARLYGVSDVDRRLPALLGELELSDKAQVLPAELSRGMRQKLVIACGLLHDPTVLLFDEPLTGLDPAGIRRMKQTIVERARQGAAVLLSSHLLHLVEEICTRVLILQRGRMVTIGTLAEILAGRPDLAGKSLEDVFLALTGGDGGYEGGGGSGGGGR